MLPIVIHFYRLRELENQLLTLEASKPSAPPALKFKVKFIVVTIHINIMSKLSQKKAVRVFFFGYKYHPGLSGGKLFLHGFSSGRVLSPERDPPRHQLPPGPHPAHCHLQQALQCLPPHRPCGQSAVNFPALTDAFSHPQGYDSK